MVKTFQDADHDHSGALVGDEMKLEESKRPLIDVNRDGKISQRELVAYTAAVFGQADLNGDEKLSREEATADTVDSKEDSRSENHDRSSAALRFRLDVAPRSAETVTCSSDGHDHKYCSADTRDGVVLVDQLSRAGCWKGDTWGYDRRGIWVANGCRAVFRVGGYGSDWANSMHHNGSYTSSPDWRNDQTSTAGGTTSRTR